MSKWFLLTLALAAAPAYAGRPLATEDASMLGAGECQVEMWADRSGVATDIWLVPACNVGAGIEWQLGGARTFESGTGALSQSYLQAKTVLRSVDDNPWGVGIVLGLNRQPRRESHTGWDDPFVLVPASFRMGEDTLVHANLGWVRNRSEGRDFTLWGLAFESPVSESVTLLGEAYGENTSRPFLRLGGRFDAVKDRLAFDLTYVNRPGGTRAERFLSLGLYYKTP
jgi:hypothetical protein